MNALASADLTRLTKICGLFGSDHVGERAAAAARADQIVRAAGLTWPSILHIPVCEKASAARPPWTPTPGEILARHGEKLTGWERGFLTNLVRHRSRWTARQAEVFQGICDKVMGAPR